MEFKVLVCFQVLLAATTTYGKTIINARNCKTNLDIKENVEHHRTGELTIDTINGSRLNHDCLKKTNFHEIIVTGLNSFELCEKGRYYELFYPNIKVTGKYRQDADSYIKEGDFSIKLESLEILFSRRKTSGYSSYNTKSSITDIKLENNDQLKNCMSKSNSLINDQIMKYSKEKLRKFIQNIWDDFNE